MVTDLFAKKAETYEQDPDRVANVGNIAHAIIAAVGLEQQMTIMDFGSGTGLLLEGVASHVGKITAVDISPSMNAQLREKQAHIPCDLEMLELDLEQTDLDRKFDGIISSMTMHHIKDVPAMFEKFYRLLDDGGFIAIADIDTEDGSFHSEDTGVQHLGFDREEFAGIASGAGFKKVTVVSASVVRKPQGDYPVFLLSAFK